MGDSLPTGEETLPLTAFTSNQTVITPGALIATGDLADIYDGTLDGEPVVLKAVRAEGNNDLGVTEATTVRALTKDNLGDGSIMPNVDTIERMRFRLYLPRLLDSYLHDGLIVNVFEPLTAMYPLSQVVADIGLIDAKDAAWIWRRLLTGIGFVHRQGFTHGALHPEHIMIDPGLHGVTLIDWCYSVPLDTPLNAIVGRYRDNYAPELLNKVPTSAGSDVYTATKTMLSIINPATLPKELKAFARACTLSRGTRPSDAWAAKEHFDDLIERLWGPRRFRPFDYPISQPTN